MWNNLEHHVWNKLKLYSLENESVYLLAISGGLDSMVLSSVLKKVRPQSKIILMHCHHGQNTNKEFRDACLQKLRDLQKLDQNCFVLEQHQAVDNLKSENDFRQARLEFFEKMKIKYNKSYYLTAHQLDDVLETQLLKLIRGAGRESLKAFQEWNLLVLRPFLEIKKEILKDYALKKQIEWIEDPTNHENDYFRNWVRNQWLPALESKMPGATQNLTQSLQNILQESSMETARYLAESPRYIKCASNNVTIDKNWFFSFNTKDQVMVLVRVIRESFQSDFTTSQIKEVLKRLDKNQNEHIFAVAGINWLINARNIVLNYKSTK